ncbi:MULTISPECIES: GNAT family N-acetyltransferase [Chromobacterium]|uniref:GNAT family N-acetyltransferase n=1 Tax=Chromobacterium TaxID=535 RepID=UPI001886BA3A|nr:MULTISPECIES: GNAT family N-acetyltransferase [Chromobacterium]QOZ82738.1 GNAT family N-acetyltransferase [Chromobacterium sp. Rain0013]WON82803.1 GNAT family N-acetyltransferase [Chromobacterium haemolyticum]
MNLQLESPRQHDALELIRQLDEYQAALYPAESNHLMDPSALERPQVRFIVARDEKGAAAGCAALVRHEDYGEIKRMFVAPSQRGKGVAQALLGRLEEEARAAGLPALKLETGVSQPEAIGLYQRAGFSPCPPFGAYAPDPLSLFMSKAL